MPVITPKANLNIFKELMKTQGKCLSHEPSLSLGKRAQTNSSLGWFKGFEFNCLTPGISYNQIHSKGEQNQNYPP